MVGAMVQANSRSVEPGNRYSRTKPASRNGTITADSSRVAGSTRSSRAEPVVAVIATSWRHPATVVRSAGSFRREQDPESGGGQPQKHLSGPQQVGDPGAGQHVQLRQPAPVRGVPGRPGGVQRLGVV